MAENYGSLEGVLDAHDSLEGTIDNQGDMSGEIQFGGGGSGRVKDVQVDDVSVVDENGIAKIDLTDYAKTEDVYDKQTIDTALEGKADLDDIPTELSDLNEDADHRTVTDAEKTAWNAKADASDIPTKLADLQDDSTHRLVTDTEKSTWDNKSDFSGSYNDLTDKPDIPSVSANPATTTETLTSIEIDGTNYAIPSGGGGAVTSVNGQTGDVVLGAEDVGALPNDTPLFSGDYNDLTNTPTIPSALADLSDDSTHRVVTDSEKSTWNGKSDFSGNYNDLSNKPTLGTASALDVASSGDASNSQVVKGDDSRLSDARTPVSHTHTTSDITDFPTMSDYIQKSNTSGFVKNDGSIDTTSYQPTESGKGLSSNDYTTAEKTKLSGISTNAKKVEASTTNGNIKIDGTETQVYDDSGITNRLDTTTSSASGNPISIAGLKSDQLAIDPVLTFEPIQSGSGTPSPSNIRAINGYDKVEVLSCGKNLFDKDAITTGYRLNNTTGMPESDASYCISDYIRVKANTAYCVTATSNMRHWFYDAGKNPVETIGSDSAFTYTPTADGYIRISIYNYTGKLPTMQITQSSTAQTYEPYTPATQLTESLGQTVYGGSLDVRTGKFTVTRKLVDLGSINYTYDSGSTRFYSTSITDVGGKLDSGGFTFKNVIFSCYKRQINADNFGAFIYINKTLYIYDNRYTNPTDLKTALTGQSIVYELTTPFTIQLTPREISLLKDYAYVSTNGTSIALDYHNGEMASLGDVSQLGETVNELGEYINTEYNDFGTGVDISSYTSASNRYTFPSDGYVSINARNNTSGYIRFYLYGRNNSSAVAFTSLNVIAVQQAISIFVKKGMRCYIDTTLTGINAGFTPLV